VITVTRDIRIPEGELRFAYTRSSGPGGQKVNKASTAVQLRFDVEGSPSLPERVRRRLVRLAGSRLTAGGELLIEARRFRTRERNRLDALARLTALIRKAAQRPKPRRPTKPSKASKRARLESKLRRGRTKELRRRPADHNS
jgi:ribosome-associated protein